MTDHILRHDTARLRSAVNTIANWGEGNHVPDDVREAIEVVVLHAGIAVGLQSRIAKAIAVLAKDD